MQPSATSEPCAPASTIGIVASADMPKKVARNEPTRALVLRHAKR